MVRSSQETVMVGRVIGTVMVRNSFGKEVMVRNSYGKEIIVGKSW